tara:strand:- start:817 stop:2109 length:1293 start_codon:yes stop_codon:yes gene_type:complete
MQVSIEALDGLERRMVISVEADKLNKLVQSKLKREAKRVRIDGFRPGKVPVSVVAQRYGAAIHEEASGELMQREFFEAVMAEKVNPAGMPEFLIQQGEDTEFKFEAKFEVYPEIQFKDLSTLEIEKLNSEIDEKDVDDMVNKLLEQHATFTSVERKAQDGDKVKIDFDGMIDGEAFDGGKSENFDLALGSNQMIPGFESAIVGHSTGEEFTIDVNFPEDYHAENLKGKAAQFKIVLKEVLEKTLPELTEEFISKFNIETGSVEALRSEIRKNMERETQQTLKKKFKDNVMKVLLDEHQFDAPKVLVDEEISLLQKQAKERFKAADNFELPADIFQPQAEERVKTGLLLGELIKQNEIKVDDERVQALIDTVAESYEDPESVRSYYKENKDMMQQARNAALEEQAMDLISTTAKVVDKKVSFNELVNSNAA